MTNAIPHVDNLQYDMLECVIVRKVNSRETEQQRGLLFYKIQIRSGDIA